MKLNRKEQPQRNKIDKIDFLKAQSYRLKNGGNVHYIHQEDQSVVKLEISFNAGTIYQPKPLVASMTNALLIEGGFGYSSSEIADYFDNEGAFLETSCSQETASITLYCLSKSLTYLLPRLQEIISSPAFSEEEIKNYLTVNKQKFAVNNEKVGYVAKKEFLPFLIGEGNAYNDSLQDLDFDRITREDILQFFKSKYLNRSFEIYVSGKVDGKSLKLIDEVFSKLEIIREDSKLPSLEIIPPQKSELRIKKRNAVQSAIRIGNISIGRNHEDFPKLYIANTILGGYFGSRLMNNIREDKGYTYGIGSGLINFKHLSYFVISTEVGIDVTENTLTEIEIEINKLRDEEVSIKELELVKNYVLGNIMRGFDGAFSAMDRFNMLNNMGLNYDYYEKLVSVVNEVNPTDIRKVSQSYLQFDKMKKVIVGKE